MLLQLIVESELLARLNVDFGEDSNAYVLIHHPRFGKAIWIARVIYETSQITTRSGINQTILKLEKN